MPALSDYLTGTISLTNGSVDFTGTSTGWLLAGFKEGDTIIDITGATEFMGVIATIDANGAGTLTKAWEGPTLVDVAYRMRYQPDGARVSAQARNLIELLGNGNVLALAGLSGSANQVPMFTGPGTMTLVPKTDLGTVNSVAAGTGISVDSTDPDAPIVSALLASNAEALAGTEAGKLMSPLRTAGAIRQLITRRQIFTSSGTYTPHANMLYAVIECVGGGGAGGGVDGQASTNMAGSGGGGGGYARRLLARASFGATEAVTVGAGGSPGAAGATTGGSGGTSSVGTLCSAGGGSGGGGATNTANINGPGAGGAATVGDLTLSGSSGGGGSGLVQSSGQAFYSGYGGSSLLSGTAVTASGASNGSSGKNFGGGGSGATSADATDRQGGAGAQGIVIITEFCWA